MQITSYEDAVKYLESFIGKIIFKVDKKSLKEHDPLDRMRILLSLLGNPQEKFKSVLVGGTSGKGSTAYLISHVLTIAGYKTGFTLSPHLEKVNERLQINGRQISDLDFTKMVTSMIRIIKTMNKMPASRQGGEIGAPSYFEILVGMAFTYFANQKVDIAVVEVGMGGEFDATNTLNPLVAVLTNVGLDHTNILGKTVEKIAKTKVGIIKKNIVVSGVKQPRVIKIVEQKCKKVGAEVFRLHKDFDFKIKEENLGGSVFDLISAHDREVKLNDLQLSLLGSYQVENASLAIETVLQLKKFGFEISNKSIGKALSTAFFPGRFEIKELKIKNFKLKIILDGAHNPTKIKGFLTTLKKLFPREHKVFIVGFKFDKDIPRMLKQITKVADRIIVTEFNRATDMNIHASADASDLKTQISKLKSGIKVIVEKDSKKALEKGIKTIGQYNNSAIIAVTGSLYLAGEIRNML